MTVMEENVQRAAQEVYARALRLSAETYAEGLSERLGIDVQAGAIKDAAEAAVGNLSDGLVAPLPVEMRRDIAASVMRSAGSRYVPVTASVTLQRWNDLDYAETVGEIKFDCSLALDQLDLKDLPHDPDDLHDKGALNCGDDIFRVGKGLGLVDWDGPYELYIADADEYGEYLEARREREGIEMEAR